VKDADFANATATGLIRFAKFVEAEKIKIDAINPVALKQAVRN